MGDRVKLPRVCLWAVGLALLGALIQPWVHGRGVVFWLFVATMITSTILTGIGWFILQRRFAEADAAEAEALALMDKWWAQRRRAH